MKSSLSRRAWLGRAAAGGFGLSMLPKVRAAEGLPRKEAGRMKLSLAAYSFRDFFKDSDNRKAGSPAPANAIDMLGFVDYCADHHCDGAEVTSYYFPKDTNREFLLKLKRHAFLRGVSLSGGAVGNNFVLPPGPEREKNLALVKKWVDYCELLGAPHIRVFAGTKPKDMSMEDAMKYCIETMREACAYAGEHGIYLGLENHGGIVAEPGPILEILKAVDSPWLGINFDSGNFRTADPFADLVKIAPYAVNVQIKTEVQPAGKSAAHADLKRVIEILRDAHYQGYVALEFEENADPWKTIPGVLEELHHLIHGTA
jgi:sugar phosphate isomerase/epimerase